MLASFCAGRSKSDSDQQSRLMEARAPAGITGVSRPPTMRDVAMEVGVSQSTVSRVLSGAPSRVPIAEETRRRVIEVAERLNYRPNPLARGLRGARTMLIGAIVRDITDPFFAGAIEALSSEAMKLGYNLVLGHAHTRAEEAIALRAILETRHCDALVVLGDVSDQPSLISDLHDATVPVVALWQGSRLQGVHSVNVDNRVGTNAVLDHLRTLGHHAIAYIGETRLRDLKEREDAFVDYFGRTGIAIPDGYVRHARNNHGGGGEALSALLALPNPPTAVVASTDVLAIGALHTAHRSGLAVPDDLSITGFDDIAMAGFTVPALTTVRMPIYEMVGAALGIVIEDLETLADRSNAGEARLMLQPSLVIRDSTGSPRVETRQ